MSVGTVNFLLLHFILKPPHEKNSLLAAMLYYLSGELLPVNHCLQNLPAKPLHLFSKGHGTGEVYEWRFRCIGQLYERSGHPVAEQSHEREKNFQD
jgi:hypothetical protein